MTDSGRFIHRALAIGFIVALAMPVAAAPPSSTAGSAASPKTRTPQQVRAATSLPTLAEIAARRGLTRNAGGDTFLVVSSGFDSLPEGCGTRGWQPEDRTSRVFAHVSDRFVVNQGIYTARNVYSMDLPASIGTPITAPHSLVVTDSASVLFTELAGSRLVAAYPAQNVVREYAALPVVDPSPFPNTQYHLGFDRSTGDVIIGTHDDNFTGRLFRVAPGGGAPVQIAGNDAGTTDDGPVANAMIGVGAQIVVDPAGNIYFVEPFSQRVRMLRIDGQVVTVAGTGSMGDEGDGGPATSATFLSPVGLALTEDASTLFISDQDSRRIRQVNLTTGVIDSLPGAGPGLFAPPDTPSLLAYSNGVLYFSTLFDEVFKLEGGVISRIAGGGSTFGPPSGAPFATSRVFNNIMDLTLDPNGGVYLCERSANLVLHLDAAGVLTSIVGSPIPIVMGNRALWFGADSTSAPDEVASWVQPQGYGSGWSQRLTSPEISLPANPNARLEFDAFIRISTWEYNGLTSDRQLSSVAVRGLKPDGTWKILDVTYYEDFAPSNGDRIVGKGIAHFEVDLGNQDLADLTRVQFLCKTTRQISNEDGQEPPGEGPLVLDNVRVAEGGIDVLAPLDFENGTVGGWTLSALNGAYPEPSFVNGLFDRDFPLPETQVELRTDFDFSDPSCVWTFTSPGDSLRNGTFARITSPWISLPDPSGSAYVAYSGKLPTNDQARVLAIQVRTKNAGESRPSGLFYGSFVYNSGTDGTDLSSPYLHQRVIGIPDDLDPGVASYQPSDSIQIVLQIEDRLEELAGGTINTRTESRLPYLDNIRIYQHGLDTDGDGVPDVLDACPAENATGQDADGNGCIDPTATLRHVETWIDANRPIRYRISQAGDPAITDGSDLAAIRAAMASWQSAPGALVPFVEDPETAQTSADLGDGINLITFEDELAFPPDVIAVTPTTSYASRSAFDDAIVLPGQIVDSDLIFNPTAVYRTAGTGMLPNSIDLESVAAHELGHMLGLSHSGVAEATMYPILQDEAGAASLEDDDRAAIAAAYPGPGFATNFGTITGTLVRGGTSVPIPGALITAWSLDGANVPTHAVASNYTDETGAFALRGLASGSYAVRADALDGSIPGLVPAAINERVRTIAITNFTAGWWSVPEDGTENPALIEPIAVSAGATASGIALVSTRDVTPPTIVSVLPADGVSNVGIDGRVLLNFSEPVEPGTIGQAFALRVTGETGRLGGTAQFLNNNKTFIYTPEDPLSFGTNYEVEITSALTDREGVAFDGPYVVHFETLPTPTVAIFDIQPRRGPVGTLITIRGQGFGGPDQNWIEYPSGSGPVTSTLAITTPTTIVTTVSAGQVSGPIRIRVGDFDYSNSFNFTVVPPGTDLPQPVGFPIALSFAPSDVAVSPEGANAFAVGREGFSTVNLSESRPHYLEEVFSVLPGLEHIALSPDGNRAYVTRPEFGEVLEVDTDTTSAGFGNSFVSIPVPGSPEGIYVTADGEHAFVTERGGSRAWAINVDPSDAQFRGIVRELNLPGITLTGGLSVSTLTETARSERIGGSGTPRRPRVQLGAYSYLFLTSTTGVAQYQLTSLNDNYEMKSSTPTEGSLATSIDGGLILAPGDGPGQGQLTRFCFNVCFPPATNTALGGKLRDVTIAPDGAVLVLNSLSGQIQKLNASGAAVTGVAYTGRNPVAMGTSGDGRIVAVANAGDHTLSLYSIGSGTPFGLFSSDLAIAGELAILALIGVQTPPAAQVDIDGVSYDYDVFSAGRLGITVPDVVQGRRNIAVVNTDTDVHSESFPFTIVDPISSFTPGSTGIDLTLPGRYCKLIPSPDGRYLSSLRNKSTFTQLDVRQLDDGAAEPMFTMLQNTGIFPEPEPPLDATYAADGTHLLVAGGPTGFTSVDADPGSPTFGAENSIGSTDGQAFSVAINPIHKVIVAGRNGNQGTGIPNGIHMYGEDGTRFAIIVLPDTIRALKVSPNGRVTVAGGRGRAFLQDLDAPMPVVTPQHDPATPMTSLAITSNGRRAVGVFANGNIGVWRLEPDVLGTELYYGNPFPPGTAISEVVAAPDGDGVIVGCSNASVLFHLDTGSDPVAVTSQAVSHPSFKLARTLDGRHLFASSNGVDTGDTLRVLALGEGRQFSVLAGGDQEALINTGLPLPVAVHLADAAGRPQYGALVELSLADATQGSLSGPDPLFRRAFTDVDGNASISWTMPALPGVVAMTLRTPGLPIAPLVVHATATEIAETAVPVILAVGPPDGAIGISASSPVFVRFSQAMDSASVAAGFRLRIGDAVIPGRYRVGDGGRTMFFETAEPLPYLASCALEVDAGMLDTEGQAVAEGVTAGFTVQAEPSLAIGVIYPPAGDPGTTVTLNGDGFGAVPAQNTVTFNGTLAAIISASTRSLIVRVPAAATTGDVVVQVASVTSNARHFVVLVPGNGGAIADTFKTRPGPLSLAITPDGQRMYVVSPRTNTVGATDIFAAQDLAVIPVGANPRSIAILPDGSRTYTANYDSGDLTVIGTDPDSADTYNKVIKTLKVGKNPIAVIASSLGPQIIVVNQGDSTVSVIDGQRDNATFDQVIKNLPVPGGSGSVVILPDGTRLFIGNDFGITVIDLASFVIKNLPVPGGSGQVVLDPDGGLLYVLSRDAHLLVIDIGSGSDYRVIKNIPVPSGSGTIAIDPDGTRIYISIPGQNQVLVFEVKRGTSGGDGTSTIPGSPIDLTLAETITVGDAPAGMAVDPFGRFVLVANEGSDDVSVIVTTSAAPVVHVAFPNGGETLVPGITSTLRWQTDGITAGQTADLFISRNSGGTWEPIATGVPNTGEYDWEVTGPQTSNGSKALFTALFRATVHNLFAVDGSDVSDAPFAIFDVATPTLLTLLAAEATPAGILMRWRLADPTAFSTVTIERAIAEAGPWTMLEVEQRDEAGVVIATDGTASSGRNYWYRLVGRLPDGRKAVLGTIQASMLVTEFALAPIAPNPAQGIVGVDFAVARETHVRLSVLDIAGRRVATLADGAYRPGLYRVEWNGAHRGGRAPAGLYFVRYEAAGKAFVRRLVYMR